MNVYITIGFKKNGKAEILATPDVPYKKQKALFRTLEGDFLRVELWGRSNGRIRERKVHPKPKAIKKDTEENSNPDNPETGKENNDEK